MTDQAVAADSKPWRDPAQKPFISIRNVTKKFGAFTAVNNVSLDIYRNELFCLLGGSGCGKSTLLRLLSGFEELTSGAIEIDGQDMAGIAPYDRQTNMMFQSYALFPHMNVEKNISYGLKRDRMDKHEIAHRVADILKLVQLEEFAKRKPHQLSGGQKQRVALARSLVKKPKVLLLDEPLGALDKKLRGETQFELIKIQETLGVTFVVVTHDQEEAMTISTRIGVMDAGEIMQVGEPYEIYEYPNSRYVAGFVGSVNMFAGHVAEDSENHVIIRSPEAGIDILVSHGVSCTPNQAVTFAIRPEKIRLSRTKPENAQNLVRGMVEEVGYLGNLSVFQIMLESGKQIRVTRPNLVRLDEDAISWDEKVYICWDGAAGVVLTS
ncbi:Putrescine transport ATP-binding protein PotG (TC 3.A.1.11.2) [hydrothermal vent metagenome]|uniref:Putrescine transport ATP-binding protein PotG (TC 3.A.1.11.2) n=1 Tax=hydrothermal vent metagenome TaxID=652676 RepID=A0A3B0UL08_9ZZZZ